MYDFTNFANWLRSHDRSEHTIRSYLSDLRAFARWFEQSNGEPLTPQGVTVLDIRDYRQYLLNVKRRQAATVNRHLSSLKTWLSWAVQSGQIDANPAMQVGGMGRVAVAPKWLSRQDEGKLLRQVERDAAAARTEPAKRQALRNRALVVLLLNTGLRAAEALDLRLDDVSMSARKGELLVRSGKRRKQRTVPLNKQARRALQDWLDVRPGEGDYLFVSSRGRRLDASQVRRLMETLSRKANIEATPHTLRHTFAKRLVDAGVSLEKVAALLGHASLETTRIYTTPSQGDLAQAVEKLEY